MKVKKPRIGGGDLEQSLRVPSVYFKPAADNDRSKSEDEEAPTEKNYPSFGKSQIQNENEIAPNLPTKA